MLTVLVTGSMGSGKSSAIAFLEEKFGFVFKADVQAKELLKPQSPCYSRLKQLFGEKYLGPNGEFNKKRLAQEIFKNSEKRKAMEAIIHPLVQKSFRQFVQHRKQQKQNKIFYEAPLISENIFHSCDKRILIICPEEIKKERLIKQGWTEEEIKERLAVQIPESTIKNHVDFVIDNSGDLKNLHTQIEKILSFMDIEIQ